MISLALVCSVYVYTCVCSQYTPPPSQWTSDSYRTQCATHSRQGQSYLTITVRTAVWFTQAQTHNYASSSGRAQGYIL